MLKWFDVYKVKIPLNTPIIVSLKEEYLESKVHTAFFHSETLGVVAGHFQFDLPPITHWANIPNLPK